MERFTAAPHQVSPPKRWRKPWRRGRTRGALPRWRLRRRQDTPARGGVARGADPKAYLTFAELAGIIGFLGMEPGDRGVLAAPPALHRRVRARRHRADLDDGDLPPRGDRAGVHVVATSNSLPDRLGEGRFAADEFAAEIAAIAAHFEVVRIDGPDYRAKARVEAEPFGRRRARHGACARSSSARRRSE